MPRGRHGRPPAASPASCARRTARVRAASAGRPRTRPRRRRPRPTVVATATARPSRTTMSVASTSRRDGDSAGRHPGGQCRGERGHPSGDRPRAEPLLQVGDQTGPRRDVARIVPVGDEGVCGHLPQPLVLEGLLEPLVQHLPAVEPLRHLAGEVRGVPRVLEVAHGAAPPSRPLNESTWSTHRRPSPGPSPSKARSWAAREWPGRPSTVPSSNQCSRTRSSGSMSSSRSTGRPLLRNRSRMTAGSSVDVGPASHSKPSAETVDTAPPSVSSRSSTVTSWPSFASRAAVARPPNPPPTTTTRATSGHRTNVGRGLHRPERGAVRRVEEPQQSGVDRRQPPATAPPRRTGPPWRTARSGWQPTWNRFPVSSSVRANDRPSQVTG